MTPRHERGSTLLLFPAAVLVLMVLGAIAVDLGSVYAAGRTLVREVGGGADDAAARLDIAHLRATGDAVIDLDAARRSVLADLALDPLPGRPAGPVVVALGAPPDTIVVEAARDIPHVFGRAVPGVPDTERITVRLTGTIRPPAA